MTKAVDSVIGVVTAAAELVELFVVVKPNFFLPSLQLPSAILFNPCPFDFCFEGFCLGAM
jgi:hypothetical protein